MTSASELHKKWMAEPDYAKAYAELETEFALGREMIEARTRAGLTQDELASRMETSRTVIARLESGLEALCCGHGKPPSHYLRSCGDKARKEAGINRERESRLMRGYGGLLQRGIKEALRAAVRAELNRQEKCFLVSWQFDITLWSAREPRLWRRRRTWM